MNKTIYVILLSILVVACIALVNASILSPNEIGFNNQTRSANYDSLLNALFSQSSVITSIGDDLWVPWFTSSSSSQLGDLHQGSSCDSGQAIDFTHNCMVTDEFSQVGILVAMGNNQTRMDRFYNTILAIKSDKGQLPGWRVYRNGNTLEACKPGVNGNCDTASDADARIISSLFTASTSSYFTSAAKANYLALATNLSRDFLQYDVVYSCKPSSLGQGNICYWLASGANAKSGGMTSTDFAYTGYFPDAILAMLHACSVNQSYCKVADDFVLNYLEASKYNGSSFSVPPGRSFSWNTANIPVAQCTGSCSPTVWDYADASRASGLCEANYYASMINHNLPLLSQYCSQWASKFLTNPASAPIQYYPDGSAVNYQNGYFAQGLEALNQAGANRALFKQTLDSALSHYTVSTNTWDYSPAFGVYMQAFAVRALGVGIGRDIISLQTTTIVPVNQISAPTLNSSQIVFTSVQNISVNCSGGLITQDISGGCRTIVCTSKASTLKILACNKPNDYSVPGYFEMYKQAQTGSGLQICLAKTCISDNGYAKSPNFPIYSIVNNPISSPVAPVTVTPTNTQVGLASVYTCSYNGQACSLISDTISGECRSIESGTQSGSIKVLACKKPNNIVELYRQQYPSGTFKVCLGSSCVDQSQGFASFSY